MIVNRVFFLYIVLNYNKSLFKNNALCFTKDSCWHTIDFCFDSFLAAWYAPIGPDVHKAHTCEFYQICYCPQNTCAWKVCIQYTWIPIHNFQICAWHSVKEKILRVLGSLPLSYLWWTFELSQYQQLPTIFSHQNIFESLLIYYFYH